MNNADKRSVSTDALETLGTIIGPNEKRDAIHLAVEPIIADEVLSPGEHVGFTREGHAGSSGVPKYLGIVDPFLSRPVQPGERFWLVVYPRQITSLRHVWTHPEFPETAKRELTEEEEQKVRNTLLTLDGWSEKMNQFCERERITREELIEHAKAYLDRGDYWCEGGRFESVYVPDEFWDFFEIATGRRVEESDRRNFFSCSC